MSLAYRYTWSVNISPLTCNKMVESARHILNRCLPDVYIYTDHRKRDQSGRLVACSDLLSMQLSSSVLINTHRSRYTALTACW